jgi:hypothetical protein
MWRAPPGWLGAVVGALVVLGFVLAHNAFISDIWFNAAPMIFAGAVCGLCVVWSYRSGIADHSSAAWLTFVGLFVVEMAVLGATSLLLLSPRWSMGELMVADDAFERLMPPSVPLMIGAMVLGTVLMWLYCDRRWAALGPLAVTQVLLVFLLGHQFAFLGLVETSSTLWRVFGEFTVITAVLAAAFGLGVMGATQVLDHVADRTLIDGS